MHKMNRGANAFLKHLYLVLNQDHEPQCLHWDITDKHKFVWHGDNEGIAAYFQVRRGRFSVSNEKSFQKKLEELGFVVCEQRFECHPGATCSVYQLTGGFAFYRGMHAFESETGPPSKRQPRAPAQHAQPACPVQPSSSPVAVDDKMFELQVGCKVIPPLVLDDSTTEDTSSFSVQEFLMLPDIIEALDCLPPWSTSD